MTRIPESDPPDPCDQFLKPRALTVSYHCPDRPSRSLQRAYRPVPGPLPSLRLQGQWLEAAGFQIGARVQVEVQPGRLIVTTEEER